MEGRKEKRNAQRFQVLLSSQEQPLLGELVSTEDISLCGLSVQTKRPWALGAIVLLKGPRGRLLGRARVVYCKPLPHKAYGLGLEFLSPIMDWRMA